MFYLTVVQFINKFIFGGLTLFFGRWFDTERDMGKKAGWRLIKNAVKWKTFQIVEVEKFYLFYYLSEAFGYTSGGWMDG